MSMLLKSYTRLLTDISSLTECTLCAPDALDMNWVLIEGPSLDKELTQYLENEDNLIEPRYSLLFPVWLRPLWDRYLVTKLPLLIKYMRQVLVFGYKAEFDPTDQQIAEAQASFENTEREIGLFEDNLSFDSPFWRTARSIVGRVIGSIDWNDIIPSHGPGAVFPPYDPYERSNFNTIHEVIETEYPFWDYFICLPGCYPAANEISSEEVAVSSLPLRAKLVAVPKDSRGPRLICVHPRESIWIQQGQRRCLEKAIVKHSNHQINFDDQTVNGRLALDSSLSQEYCTLDLKDASDRLLSSVVRYLFGTYAYNKISCTRAEEVTLLDGRVIKLRKWAPMGNALCFPVESLCFWAAVHTGIIMKFGNGSKRSCFVFGDDIIVPSEYYDAAVDGLTRFGLMVNSRKSFRKGFFRESCGVDAFKGIDVTPHRMKRHSTATRPGIESLCALAKNLRIDGFDETSSYIYSKVRSVLGYLPLSNNPDAAGFYEYVNAGLDYLFRYEPQLRWSRDLHIWQVPVVGPSSITARGFQERRCNLLDSLLSLERRDVDAGSLPSGKSGLVYPVPSRVRYKRRWSPVRYC